MAAALGLGELTLDSYLNEPLSAEVSLLETGELDPTQIRVQLATSDDYARAGVERAFFLTSLQFEVVSRGQGEPVLVITSRDPVREPYLNFIVEARWPTGRLLREYTVLLDPPVFVGEESGITARAYAPARPAPQETTSRPSPAPAPAEPTLKRAPTSRMTDRTGYGSSALDTPVSGSDYFVQRNDTLWQIAEAARPSGVSIQQTMLDILRMNPEAFIGNNINQLKAGYVLRLPTADEITPMSFEDAVAEVERQTQRWRDAAAGLDVRMDASEGLDLSGVSGSGGGEGHLQISGVEDSDEPAGGDISARMEDFDRTRRENQELSTRLDDMQRQLETQERLISLKDDQISALQEALSEANRQTEASAEVQEGTISEGSALDDDPPESEIVEAAPPAKPTPTPTPTPKAPPPEPTLVESVIGMVMGNIIYIGAGIAAIVLLLVLVLMRNRLFGGKKSQDFQHAGIGAADDDDFADVSLSDDSLIIDEVDEDTAPSAEAPQPVSSYSSARDEEAYAAQFESGDALAEADIYIAYGRFPQAVDLLKAAIAHEPANTDYRIKLMEACVEMVESAEFQQQYADLQVIGDENILQRARSLLEAVDGGEVWLDDLPPASITSDEVAAARAAAASQPAAVSPSPERLDLDLDIESADVGFEDELELDDGALEEIDDLTASLDESPGELDMDFDEAEAEVSDAGFEDDFDLDETAVDEDLDLEVEVPEPAEEEIEELTLDTVADDSDELESIDLPDLEVDTLGGDVAEDEDVEEFDLSGDDDDDLLAGLDDLEVDLGGGGAAAPAPEPEPLADDTMLELDSELDGVEFDLGDDSGADGLEDIELDMSAEDEEGLVFAADGDEMATKLDLARAYIDMGDHDGARTILDEVVSSGTEIQQREATLLLEGID